MIKQLNKFSLTKTKMEMIVTKVIEWSSWESIGAKKQMLLLQICTFVW